MDQLRQLAGKLVQAHVPENANVMEKYGIHAGELTKGVFCPECSAVPMSRKVGKWFCVKCHHQSVDAHLPALNDYKLLISNRISNRGARDFLQVGSPYIESTFYKREDSPMLVKRMLVCMRFPNRMR